MIDPADTGELTVAVGRRLRRTRLLLGLDQQQFGTGARLSQPQYNQFENGKRLLTLHAALKLCDEYNLTLDWLYRGDPSGLPYRLATEIRDRE
jgi:transcriptional regulator with XRE-family HTH domain